MEREIAARRCLGLEGVVLPSFGAVVVVVVVVKVQKANHRPCHLDLHPQRLGEAASPDSESSIHPNQSPVAILVLHYPMQFEFRLVIEWARGVVG